jgi:hypothetical protein
MLTVNEFNAINKKNEKKEGIDIFESIIDAISNAQPGKKSQEIHLQMIKHMDYCNKHNINGEGFCKRACISSVWGCEFTNMRSIYDKLVASGLDCSLI